MELGAPEAETLIATVPKLARLLSRDQVAQVQRVLDAAVLNPLYEDAYRNAMKAAVISRAGNLVLRDRAKERKARRILDKRVHVSRSDGCIRVDHNKMLTADALVPRSNNPDEADYLVRVRQTLESKGIWLRLGQPWNAQGNTPTEWEFWFSLGYDGDTIKTDDALIDREELLDTTMLGAGYYRSVLTGHVQTKLKRAFERFDTQYDNGWSMHMDLMRDRHSAAPGVAKVSDWLGGATFPATSIWNRPHKLRMKAWEANAGGDVIKAQVYLLAAAHGVEYNAQLLADYVSDTIGGAETAVKILKVAKTSGQVAEGVLLVVGVGAGIKALRVAGSKAISQEVRYDAAEKLVRDYARKEGISQAELKMVRYVPQPRGTVLGNIKGGHSAGYGTGPHSWP
ncbi:hypothetical protein [Roseibium marinum]|uniref:Uncharacterized protein n=1 Tax=Roseibium marinum TaxID=281252 RepID=A0A2S3V2H3_9HYPH|nr:hypothetical protein [Roseibium marinum]POF34171.1 hypothetical protein CLV41_101623 [Roseibium marinum]